MHAALAALALLAAPAATQAPPTAPDTAVVAPAARARIDELVGILAGAGDYDRFFDETFRAQVPLASFQPLRAQLIAALGQPRRIERVVARTPWQADVSIVYERGTAAAQIVISAAAPHLVTGLRITGTGPATGDTAAALQASFAQLPGRSGFGIWALSDGAPRLVIGTKPTDVLPLGSGFKLWILAEAVRQVGAGERRWSDVVSVGRPSLPSGVLQRWPAGSPVTLQTLATLMISISDNTATDTLMAVLGRARIDALAASMGGATPVLTTREAFAIKADVALTARWAAADAAGRRAILAAEHARIDAAALDAGIFTEGKPLAADTVEWFASPAQMAMLLDRLRGDATARAILAVEPGTDVATAARFDYLGYKGGSEPGVIAMSFVVRGKDGGWYAVTGGWTRGDGAVPTLQFGTLMNRALALVAAR